MADHLSYRTWCRAEGVAWSTTGGALVVLGAPGVLYDWDAPWRGGLFAAVMAVWLAARSRRSGRRAGSLVGGYVADRAADASPFRDPLGPRRALRGLVTTSAGTLVLVAAWLVGCWAVGASARAAAPIWVFGPGLGMVVLGAALTAGGPDAAASAEAVAGGPLAVAARARLSLRGPRLAIIGDSARQARASVADETILACRGLRVAYGPVTVLHGIDFDVRRGEVIALLGTNGAGKSTLLRAVSGLVDPTGGVILLDGRDIAHEPPGRILAAGVGHVPGGRGVFPSLTVREHLRLARWAAPNGVSAATSEAILEEYPALAARVDVVAGALSGGEQQMLAVAIALMTHPPLVVIDELSLGLAPTVVAQLLDVVRRLRSAGTSVILVEQSVNVALSIADRAYFLERGRVRFEGRASELLARDDLLRAVFLADAPSRVTPHLEDQVKPAAVLEVDAIRKRFGGVVAVDVEHLVVQREEIVGLLGANGAGKTTLIDLISGHLEPDSGSIRVGGVDVSRLPADRRSRLGLGRTFQDARLFPALTTAQNLAVALERHLEYRDLLGPAFWLPEATLQEADVELTVDELLERFGLGPHRHKTAAELSTGTRRIVELAMAFAHQPDVLLLDEPAAGVAQREVEALGELLQSLRADTRCAMLIIEHDVPFLAATCDRLVAMHLGRPIAQGSPSEVLAHPEVVAAYLGTDAVSAQRSGAAPAVA